MAGRSRNLCGALLLLAGAGLAAAPAQSASGSAMDYAVTAHADPVIASQALGDNGGASRDRVIDAVQKRFNAKVVRVTETSVNGRAALELRLLSEQRVFSVVVDAESGQVLSGG
jgi:uncharacterized membrane protein YkoI